ncbi:MAG TPA: pilus assembly protein [Hyphomonas sp.]|nr:pilus assembly protein [Hyphomonas sp.]MCB9970417.1 pilus assembly protein [Hyphomonas sp.]HPE47667.1 pilus assembly protein [Hyphomonas sp.]
MTSFAPGVIAPRLHRKLQDWASERRGAVAVEFALIAIPFFFIVFGLLEVCLLFIMSTVLEHSISEASREIRTGQAQEAGFSEQDFRDAICSELFGLLDCGSNLHIDVRKLSGFGSASTDMPLDSDGNFDETGFGFDPGGANDVVAVRVFYEWTLLTPILSAPLVNMNGSKHLIQANAVFRNEPFGD